MIFGHISACIISLTFFPIRKSGNYFVRDSCGFSFTSHSKLRMRDKNSVQLHFHLHFCTDNWTGILFWFSRFSSINALTNCPGIVGLPLIIICSFVFWNFSSFSVYFRWHSCDLAFVCCLIFCICYGLCYLAYILCSICLPIAFHLYSCLAFHSCGIQVKAWEELDKSFIETVHLLALQITPASWRFR